MQGNVIAKDIRDVRSIVGRKYNKALLKSIKYAKSLDQFKRIRKK